MTKGRKLIQLILIFSGLFLILATYFFYPNIKQKKLEESVIEEDIELDVASDESKDNTFESVEYRGFYDFDKPFFILSEKAYILSDNPNIVYMTNMKVSINLNDGRTVIITSDEGKYNKVTYDCFFEKNVKATDNETTILSENLDLLATKDSASIYNKVYITSKNGSLKADKVDYNFESKYYKVSMFNNNKKVKVKLIE